MFNFFKKKNQQKEISLTEFLEKFNTDQDINILSLLNFPIDKLVKASEYKLSLNPQDIKNGVTEVYYRNFINVFNVFDSFVFKIYNDGMKQYFLYVTSNKSEEIFSIGSQLYSLYGAGNNINEENHKSFKNLKDIEKISKGFVYSSSDDCVDSWYGKADHSLKYQIYLQYKVHPLRQFVLNINEY